MVLRLGTNARRIDTGGHRVVAGDPGIHPAALTLPELRAQEQPWQGTRKTRP